MQIWKKSFKKLQILTDSKTPRSHIYIPKYYILVILCLIDRGQREIIKPFSVLITRYSSFHVARHAIDNDQSNMAAYFCLIFMPLDKENQYSY